jgi:competence protein ComEA
MKKHLREFFSLSIRERRGTWLLAVILILFTLASHVISLRHVRPLPPEPVAWMTVAGTAETAEAEPVVPEELPVSEFREPPRDIDPNSATFTELVQAGMPVKAARNLIRYRQAGGRIREAGDLRKIYGMEEGAYNRLAPAVRIPEEWHEKNAAAVPLPRPVIELNAADSAALESLPGIGPVLARRIIRYRNRLGGFARVSQLAEVYGITDSLVTELGPRLRADTSLVTQLNLNEAGEKELAAHPYIGKYLAGGILRYRKHVQHIGQVNDLVMNGLISKTDLERMRPYLRP